MHSLRPHPPLALLYCCLFPSSRTHFSPRSSAHVLYARTACTCTSAARPLCKSPASRQWDSRCAPRLASSLLTEQKQSALRCGCLGTVSWACAWARLGVGMGWVSSSLSRAERWDKMGYDYEM
ncbi:hypothetical protein BDN70DRAFT_271454 [Pholiota conissans]|uniref:Uncharacterized protein n=1 Tax=Pholiota conissans TaxID=109636 RepID=A0A9P6CPX1_9AGAR|nr:hypothetical protein BDN70DRAFT_271454 [Pholiota conissans]